MRNNDKNRTKRDDTATVVAEMMGVTASYVRKVVNGARENERILSAYIMIKEGKNKLLEAVKNAVPFN